MAPRPPSAARGIECPPQPVYLRRGYMARVPDVQSWVWQSARHTLVDLAVLGATTIFDVAIPANMVLLATRLVFRCMVEDNRGFLGGHAWRNIDDAGVVDIGRFVPYYGRTMLAPLRVDFNLNWLDGWRMLNENVLDVGEIGCVAIKHELHITVDFIVEQAVGGNAQFGAELGGRLVSLPTYQALVKDAKL